MRRASAKASDSRARGRSKTAERVDAIADMMREGAWRRGQSDKVLGEEWGISPSHVRNISAEAWRRICAEADDADKARPTIAGTLMTNLADASNSRKFGEVAKLADVYSRVVGARAPDKIEDVTRPELRSDEELLAIADSVAAALRSRA